MSELIDNRAFKIRTLKEIILRLHGGEDPEAVKGDLTRLVQEVDASEIAAMEQELISDGMEVKEVQSMCDLHSQVLREVLVEAVGEEEPPAGHPVDTLKRENRALEEALGRAREIAGELGALAEQDLADDLMIRWRGVLAELLDVEKHYQRKENLLFPCLERHGVSGPSKVMWGKHDEVRDLLRTLDEALRAEGVTAGELRLVAEAIAEPAFAAVTEMIFKEEKILIPMATDALTNDEWGEIWQQSPEYGWCLVEPGEGYRPPAAVEPDKAARIAGDEAMVFATGSLKLDQLTGILKALPVDVTFVDADDRVRYFSEGADRVFARSKAIIGREVQHCHPPKSVGQVEQILADFKSGRQDIAEFWIELHGKFIHIRYFAVRDEAGEYLGTLEVTQDLTRLRALEGDRRLLQYDSVSEGVDV